MSQRLKISLPDRCLLYQALLWVSDSVRPIPDRYFLSLPDPATLGPTDASKRDLLLALMSGRLKAEGILWGDENEFESRTADLSPNFWEVGEVDWQKSRLQVPNQPGRSGAFDIIKVTTSKLMEVFPDPSVPAQIERLDAELDTMNANTPTPTTTKRGRPPIYDWSAFFAEIIVRADLDGLPDSQAELERSMADWCQDQWGASPGDSTIREKISPIYNHFRKVRK